jgi:hypothetical protein
MNPKKTMAAAQAIPTDHLGRNGDRRDIIFDLYITIIITTNKHYSTFKIYAEEKDLLSLSLYHAHCSPSSSHLISVSFLSGHPMRPEVPVHLGTSTVWTHSRCSINECHRTINN